MRLMRSAAACSFHGGDQSPESFKLEGIGVSGKATCMMSGRLLRSPCCRRTRCADRRCVDCGPQRSKIVRLARKMRLPSTLIKRGAAPGRF